MESESFKFDLKQNEFNKFREMINTESGIRLDDIKKSLVEARLAKRLRAFGFTKYEEYYNYLVNNYETEKINFINALTTNRTEFFRENHHFEYLTKEYLPFLEAKKSKTIRVWSAACSTGEEPYTIGMTILEYFHNRAKPDIKILATDIDTNVLTEAKSGTYWYDLVKNINPALLRKYFTKIKENNRELYQVNKELRDLVYFNRLNLQDDTYPMKKMFDIVFCRNVIIYFNKETQKIIFSKISKHMPSHGRLFIGHSENITNISNDFYLIGKTIYRKAD